jgi:predicted dithiol-disulfide oxidoreductase (DUF899 family)
MEVAMSLPEVVSREEWQVAREQLLAREKELTRRQDALNADRRRLPMVRIDKDYVFEGEAGEVSLPDLFDGCAQLVVYHAMFSPETAGKDTPWTADAPCYVCSFWMDNFNGITVHLNHRDITMAAVSRAPYAKIAAYRERMGWTFPWYSSAGSDFNFDYGVSFTPEDLERGEVEYNYRPTEWSGSEAPGISVFLRKGERIYHTYSTYERGLDMLNVAYHYMDLVPKGRDEGGEGAGAWVHRHDEYPD